VTAEHRPGETRPGGTRPGDATDAAEPAGADMPRSGDAAEPEPDVDGDGEVVGAGFDSPAGADPPDDGLDAAAAAVEADFEQVAAERDEFFGAFQRTRADFENYRKQAQRRQDEAVQRALGTFVENLLPVLDSCDAAVAHGSGDAVEPILGALYAALEKGGLQRIDPVGKPFDPAEADAVAHEPGEGGDPVVAEVMRPGYRWRGQVLRPAMVKVTD